MTAQPRHLNHLPESAPDDLRWFYDYWCSKRPSEDANPQREAIDPADFPKLLNTTFIVQRMEDERHKVRLAGTFYHSLYGREITGAYIEELAPLNTAGRTLGYAQNECARSNGPVYTEARMVNPAFKQEVSYKRLLLPLAGPARDLEFMIGTAVFFDRDGNRIETGSWP